MVVVEAWLVSSRHVPPVSQRKYQQQHLHQLVDAPQACSAPAAQRWLQSGHCSCQPAVVGREPYLAAVSLEWTRQLHSSRQWRGWISHNQSQ
jgi:hypothetical protein